MTAAPSPLAACADPPVPALALSAAEAARSLGIGQRLLWSMTNSKQIPHVRISGRIVYPVHLLKEWLAQRAEGGGHDQ
ncbi:MAG TPA: helix-turn-helix domain-containing protein [Phycisphaerae bacterium]|jgi:hypothetical protein